MKARKRFGQHFLSDEAVLLSIVNACRISSTDAVVEIGPGHGALTEHIIAAQPRSCIAVEIDRDLTPLLAARYPSLNLINEDILRIDLESLTTEHGEGLRVVGNLPYNISTPLLLKLAAWSWDDPDAMRDGVFMVQKELGERLAAVPGNKSWGRLSIMVQLSFDVEYLFDVPPESFTPPPKVWSSVVRLLPATKWRNLDPGTVTCIDQLCRAAFAGRRKKLSNALKQFEIEWSMASVKPESRADDVSLEDFVSLAQNVIS